MSCCTRSGSLFSSLEAGAADGPSHRSEHQGEQQCPLHPPAGKAVSSDGTRHQTSFCHPQAPGLRETWSRSTVADCLHHMQWNCCQQKLNQNRAEISLSWFLHTPSLSQPRGKETLYPEIRRVSITGSQEVRVSLW